MLCELSMPDAEATYVVLDPRDVLTAVCVENRVMSVEVNYISVVFFLEKGASVGLSGASLWSLCNH